MGRSQKEGRPRNLIKAGISISSAYNLKKSGIHFRQYLGGRLEKYLVSEAKKDIYGKNKENKVFLDFLAAHKIDYETLMKSVTFRDVDDILTHKANNTKDADEYYKVFSGQAYMDYIRVPLLSLYSKQDPICQYSCVDHTDTEKNENLINMTVGDGAHIEYPHGWSM